MSESTDDARVALVTGGSSGIGAATCHRLLASGFSVVALGRDGAKLRALKDKSGATSALVITEADVTSEEAVRRAVAATLERFGRIDAVIASAGFATHDRMDSGEPARWERMLITNVLGSAIVVHATMEAIKRTRGRYVFLGSVAGLKNTPGNMYSVSKWAVSALAENTRLLLAADGVGVSLVAPGRVDTPFWEGCRTANGDRTPGGPMLSPGAVANAIAWVLEQPREVDVNSIVLRPTGQVS